MSRQVRRSHTERDASWPLGFVPAITFPVFHAPKNGLESLRRGSSHAISYQRRAFGEWHPFSSRHDSCDSVPRASLSKQFWLSAWFEMFRRPAPSWSFQLNDAAASLRVGSWTKAERKSSSSQLRGVQARKKINGRKQQSHQTKAT